MSKRRPQKKAVRAARAAEKALSSWDGANYSTNRGFIYVPTLETGRELDQYTHRELLRKARWFPKNSGFARRVVRGAGQMVGFLSPVPKTSDEKWNKLAEANFENRAGSAQVFDVSGKYNFYSIQPKLISAMIQDGDLLPVFTKTANGGAAIMVYEAHQIGNSATSPEAWKNGVLTNGYNRPLAYNILNGAGSFTVSAADAVLFADYESFGHTRGVTGFAHAINHLHDRIDNFREIKLQQKAANTLAFYRTRPAAAPRKSAGMGGRLSRVAPDPSRPDVKLDLEEVMRGGKVPELGDGEEFKLLFDQRPHPNVMAFDAELIRDMSWGVGLSPEVLWFVGKINGTSNRFLLADAAQWVDEKRQLLVDLFLTRYWVYHMACEMKAGRLPRCEDPEWWKVGWIGQPRLTVDRGRDGKLNIEMRRSGMFTLRRHYAEQFAEDWKPNVDDWSEEIAYQVASLAGKGFSRAEAITLLGMSQGSLPSAALPDPADPAADPENQPSPLVNPGSQEEP